MVIGNNLKIVRTANNLIQDSVASLLNISKKTYSHYETGEVIIPLDKLNIFCNYYDVSFDFIFGLSDIKNYENITNELNNKVLGERLKTFRKEILKINQKNLSKQLGIDPPVLSRYENGERQISTIFLYDICKKYNVSADYLLGKIDFMPTMK